MWDQWIRARFASHLLGLKASIADQSGLRAAVPRLIEGLIAELGSLEGKERRFQPTTDRSGDRRRGRPRRRAPEGGRGRATSSSPAVRCSSTRAPARWSGCSPRPSRRRRPPYAAWTTAHDRVARSRRPRRHRDAAQGARRLEKKRAEFRRDFSRLVSKLQRKLLARQTRDWSFDLDEGLVDASRLDRVVVNPGFASAYKQEQELEFRDTIVSILIDNSGSMRGKPIEIACLASDMIAAALERCGVPAKSSASPRAAGRAANSARTGPAPAARKSRPPQRHAAHRLQIRRRADAPRASSPSAACSTAPS